MIYTNENDIDVSKLGKNPYKHRCRYDFEEMAEDEIMDSFDPEDAISMDEFKVKLAKAKHEDQNRPISPQALTLLTWIMTREHPERDYVLLYYKDIAKNTKLTQVQAKDAILRLSCIGVMCRTLVRRVYWLNPSIVHGIV